MSTSDRRPAPTPVEKKLNLTQNLRKLSIPAAADTDSFEEDQGTVLLLCRDSASLKWGPRWLRQAGLVAKAPRDPRAALLLARELKPNVIIVEASLQADDGLPIYRQILDSADVSAPVIVLCASSKEVAAVVETDAFDIARKPFDWQLVSRRANHAWRLTSMQKQLNDSKTSLEEALGLAEAARERLRSRESFEPVTGLPNKTKFVEFLRRGMRAVDRDQNQLAVFVVGFNRFRLVIEAMGQEQADLILNHIGQNLATCLREAAPSETPNHGLRTAAAASLDQFRFGLMLTWSGEEDELTRLHQDLMATLSQPIQVAGQTVHLSACLGVALYPQDADDADSLLQRADNAMRDAQSRGGGFKYYCVESDAAAARKLRIEHLLHEALDKRELSLVYQPIAGTSGVDIVGIEALLRWRQADGTEISPTEFVPIAEESGLMIRTGEFALDEACRQLRDWRDAGFVVPQMCINVAKVQLMSGDFPSLVVRTLDRYGLEPDILELELSERGVLSGDYEVIAQLHELKSLGIRLSVDDFGTGDSAIAYLKDLPIDALKIDRSYVAGLQDNRKDFAIASAMVALGHRLDLQVIAEGVESQEQLSSLKDLGCDAVQGFLISEPVPPQVFEKFIKNTAK
jgi:EAL domain-containing protein (putative c-di-GMP-specific phosphodiesterase class I)/PleD family two-component response regulator